MASTADALHRTVKTSLDFTQASDSEWQSDNHASTQPLSFYRPDALPAAQPTASKH